MGHDIKMNKGLRGHEGQRVFCLDGLGQGAGTPLRKLVLDP